MSETGAYCLGRGAEGISVGYRFIIDRTGWHVSLMRRSAGRADSLEISVVLSRSKSTIGSAEEFDPEPGSGFEPLTCALRVRCSAG